MPITRTAVAVGTVGTVPSALHRVTLVRARSGALKNLGDDLLKDIGGPSHETLERLIYIVGSARGGTTITQSIIELNDGFITMVRPSNFLNYVWRYRKVLHENLWQELLWAPPYLRWGKVRKSLPEPRRSSFIRLISRAVAKKNLHDLYRLYPLVRALDSEEKRESGSLVAWLDKGNDFWGVDLLPLAFPRSRFVFTVRNPRGGRSPRWQSARRTCEPTLN